MKNKQRLAGIASLLLLFVIQTVNADTDFGAFNADAPLFGFIEVKRRSKAPKARDLTLNAYFAKKSDTRVAVRRKDFGHNEFKLQLDLFKGSDRIAELELKIKTDRSENKNYITYFKYSSSQTGKKQSEYRGNRSSLEKNFTNFFSIIEQFYNVNALSRK